MTSTLARNHKCATVLLLTFVEGHGCYLHPRCWLKNATTSLLRASSSATTSGTCSSWLVRGSETINHPTLFHTVHGPFHQKVPPITNNVLQEGYLKANREPDGCTWSFALVCARQTERFGERSSRPVWKEGETECTDPLQTRPPFLLGTPEVSDPMGFVTRLVGWSARELHLGLEVAVGTQP